MPTVHLNAISGQFYLNNLLLVHERTSQWSIRISSLLESDIHQRALRPEFASMPMLKRVTNSATLELSDASSPNNSAPNQRCLAIWFKVKTRTSCVRASIIASSIRSMVISVLGRILGLAILTLYFTRGWVSGWEVEIRFLKIPVGRCGYFLVQHLGSRECPPLNTTSQTFGLKKWSTPKQSWKRSLSARIASTRPNAGIPSQLLFSRADVRFPTQSHYMQLLLTNPIFCVAPRASPTRLCDTHFEVTDDALKNFHGNRVPGVARLLF